MCLLSAFYSIPLVHIPVPIIVSHCFMFLALKRVLISGRVTLPPVFFFFKYDLALSESLSF